MKKVFFLMAMFSMVAMMAACGGEKKEDNKKAEAVDLTKIEAQAQELAQKACECNGDEACINAVNEELANLIKDLDEANKGKINEVYTNALNECTALTVEPEEEQEVAEPTKTTTKKTTKTAKKDPTAKTTDTKGDGKTITVTKVGGGEVEVKKPTTDKSNINKVGTVDTKGSRKN